MLAKLFDKIFSRNLGLKENN